MKVKIIEYFEFKMEKFEEERTKRNQIIPKDTMKPNIKPLSARFKIKS